MSEEIIGFEAFGTWLVSMHIILYKNLLLQSTIVVYFQCGLLEILRNDTHEVTYVTHQVLHTSVSSNSFFLIVGCITISGDGPFKGQ